jgi:hypothetical protein
VHQAHQPPDDGQAEPGPLEMAGVVVLALDEGLEDVLQQFVRDADSRVVDHEEHPGRVVSGKRQQGNVHAHASLGGELDGVAHEVEENLAQPDLVAEQGLRKPFVQDEFDLQSFLAGGQTLEFENGLTQVVQGEQFAAEREASRFDAGDVQQVRKQPQETVGRLGCGLGVVVLLRLQVGNFQELEHAQHAVEGRPDFVAHVRQEFGLGPAGGFGLLLGLEQGLLGQLAGGQVVEDAGEEPRRGPEGRDLEVFADGAGKAFEEGGFSAQGHVAVRLDPVRLGFRHEFQHGPAQDVFGVQPRELFKGGVDGQEAVVAGLAVLVEDDLVQGEAVEHLAEERLVFLLQPALPGDVAAEGKHGLDRALVVLLRDEPPVEHGGAGRGLKREFHVQGLSGLEHLEDRPVPERALLLRKAQLPVRLADEVLRGDAQQFFDVVGNIEVAGVRVVAHHVVGQPVDQRAVEFFAFAQVGCLAADLPTQEEQPPSGQEQEDRHCRGGEIREELAGGKGRTRQDRPEPLVVERVVGAVGNDDGQSLVQIGQELAVALAHGKAEFLLESLERAAHGLEARFLPRQRVLEVLDVQFLDQLPAHDLLHEHRVVLAVGKHAHGLFVVVREHEMVAERVAYGVLFGRVPAHDDDFLVLEILFVADALVVLAHEHGAVHAQVGRGEVEIPIALLGIGNQGQHVELAVHELLLDFAPRPDGDVDAQVLDLGHGLEQVHGKTVRAAVRQHQREGRVVQFACGAKRAPSGFRESRFGKGRDRKQRSQGEGGQEQRGENRAGRSAHGGFRTP